MALRANLDVEIRETIAKVLNSHRGLLRRNITKRNNDVIVRELRECEALTPNEKQEFELLVLTQDDKNDILVDVMSKKTIVQFRRFLKVLREEVSMTSEAEILETGVDEEIQKIVKRNMEDISAETKRATAIKKLLQILRSPKAEEEPHAANLLLHSANELEKQFREKIEQIAEEIAMDDNEEKCLNFLRDLHSSHETLLPNLNDELKRQFGEKLNLIAKNLIEKITEEQARKDMIQKLPKIFDFKNALLPNSAVELEEQLLAKSEQFAEEKLKNVEKEEFLTFLKHLEGVEILSALSGKLNAKFDETLKERHHKLARKDGEERREHEEVLKNKPGPDSTS